MLRGTRGRSGRILLDRGLAGNAEREVEDVRVAG